LVALFNLPCRWQMICLLLRATQQQHCEFN
jgi:hypothetical protein